VNTTRTFVDAVGIEHAPADQSARIVSLVPSITELLFALGLGPQVVGRTTFCIHPANEVAKIQRVGGTKKIHMDRLRRTSPTHVIVNIDENSKSDVEEIATFVPNIIVTHPLTPSDNIGLYRLLGSIFNRSSTSQLLCSEFEKNLSATIKLGADLPRLSVLYLIWYQPWMTISPPTYIAELLALVNWITPDHQTEQRYPALSASSFAVDKADLVLFSSEPFPFKDKHIDAFAKDFSVERNRLVAIDGEMTSWYGSRAIKGLCYLYDLAKHISERQRSLSCRT